MEAIANLFRKWLARLPVQDIGDGHGNLFFNRYTVLKSRLGSIYLHQFFRGDVDQCLHDHPWSFVSIVVMGGYVEELQVRPPLRGYPSLAAAFHHFGTIERHDRPAGSVLFRRSTTLHRIAEVKPGTWSLVFVGRKSRPWGFLTVHGWRQWVNGQGSPICEVEQS